MSNNFKILIVPYIMILSKFQRMYLIVQNTKYSWLTSLISLINNFINYLRHVTALSYFISKSLFYRCYTNATFCFYIKHKKMLNLIEQKLIKITILYIIFSNYSLNARRGKIRHMLNRNQGITSWNNDTKINSVHS